MSTSQSNISINPNKQKKYRSKLEKLLDKCRIDGSSNSSITHVTLDPLFPGKYSFDKENRKKLNKYVKEANKHEVNMGIAEKPKDYSPIKVDIDLEIPKEDYKNKRLYNDDLILKTTELYRDGIRKYLDVNDSQLQACILEKDNISDKGLVVRDGLHIIFPYICSQSKVRHLIREHVVNEAKNLSMFKKFTKSVDEIFDKSIISSNFWIMYGNSKPKCRPYKLTQIIAHDDSEMEISEFIDDESELVDIFSLQNNTWKESNATPLNSSYSNEDIEYECSNKGIDNTNNTTAYDNILPLSREEEFRKAKYLVSLLSDERAENYQDWIRVGWALHNTDICLLEVWVDFSKRCSKKFNEKECERLWQNMKPGLSIRSLQSWAKEDNYTKYTEYMKSEFKELLTKSTNGDTYSVAKALHTKYFDRFVCSSMKHNSWYEFKTHRWNRNDCGWSLQKLISEEFVNEYILVSTEYNLKAVKATGIEKEDLQKKASNFQRISDKLLNLNYKKQIMEECKLLFFDETFEDRLDENHDLLGCQNGVYDFAKSEFRAGRPDDCITLSTGNSYHNWNPNNPYSKNIVKFFEEILPNKNVRNYFLQALCTCLTGHNREEKLYIPTGSGANGKSLTFELVNLALGDYYISCPVTIMTRKRGASSQASPELARIKGKRIGVLQEPDNNETINVGIMKELTGNDAFQARGLFEEPKDIKPQIKFFLTCNDLPVVPSCDGGTWRRLRVIAFMSKFVDKPSGVNQFKIDTRLKEKIKEWGPTFLSYLIYIFNSEYKKKNYLEEPDDVKYTTNMYKADNDHYTEYFNTRLEITSDAKTFLSKKNVYSDFKSWFSEFHGTKVPRCDQLYKFLDETIGKENSTRTGWKRVNFKVDEIDDDDDTNLDI